MADSEHDWDDSDLEAWLRREEERELSSAGIGEQNRHLLRRYREFRRAADSVVEAWQSHPEVVAVALIGSLAAAPYKEVRRSTTYRRARIAL